MNLEFDSSINIKNVYASTTITGATICGTNLCGTSKIIEAGVCLANKYLGTGGTAVCATCAGNASTVAGCTPSCFLGATATASDSSKLGGQLPAYYLNSGSTITCAADSAKLNNKLPAYYLNTGSTAICATCAISSKALCGCVPASFLLSGGTALCSTTAGNALCINGHTEANLSVNNAACVNGHTESNLVVATANNATCLGGNLANTYAPLASPSFTTQASSPKFIENSVCLANKYLATGGTAICATCAGNASTVAGCTPSCFLGATATAVCATCAISSKALCGCVPASFLLSGGTAVCATCAGNASTIAGCTPSCFLGTTACATDSAKLNNKLPAYYLNTGSTAICATCAIGAKSLCGCVPASFLLSGGTAVCATTAGNALCLNGHTEAALNVCNAVCVNGHAESALSVANAACLNGQLASYYQTALTNPITGTGTANYVPQFCSASALCNSPIQTQSISGTTIGVGHAAHCCWSIWAGKCLRVECGLAVIGYGTTVPTYAGNWDATGLWGIGSTTGCIVQIAGVTNTTCTQTWNTAQSVDLRLFGSFSASTIICAGTCFAGSGAGLTGTASNLSVNNSACINGHLEAALNVCNAVCVNGHAESTLNVANAACLGGALANTYAPLTQPNFIPPVRIIQQGNGTIASPFLTTGITAGGTASTVYPAINFLNSWQDTNKSWMDFSVRGNSGEKITAMTLDACGVVCANCCFAGSGAGLTGTAASLTAGCATNSASLGGNLAACYALLASPTFTTTLCLCAATPILSVWSSSYPLYPTTLGVNSDASTYLIFGNNGQNEIRAGRCAVGGCLDIFVNNTCPQTTASNGIKAMHFDSTGLVCAFCNFCTCGCFMGSGAGLTGTAASLTANNASCVNSHLEAALNVCCAVCAGSIYGNSAVKLNTMAAGICVCGCLDIAGCTSSVGLYLRAGCGCAIDWVASSDCRLKTDIQPISNALSIITQLQGICYHLCDDCDCENRVGLIAQDVELVLPEIVSHGKPDENDVKYGITDEKLGLKYDKLTAVLVEAIKEQQTQIDNLEIEINKLKNK